MVRTLSLLAAVLALAAAGCASTAPGLSEGIDGAFIRAAPTWDLNHDGNVTCEEWRQYAVTLFREADQDHDGKLTKEEFERLAKVDRLFLLANLAYFDTDHKGYVTEQDITGHPNPAFVQLDKEQTCVLKTNQLRAAITDEPKRTNPGTASRPGGGGH